MTKNKLSPEAEAAWNAYCDVADRIGIFEDTGDALAAFLRELITQIEFRGELGLTPFGAHGRYQEKLYAIATELEGFG